MDKLKLKARTKDFAHRCVKLALSLPKNALGIHIRGQLIRCGTSVAANYRASLLAQSKILRPSLNGSIGMKKVRK